MRVAVLEGDISQLELGSHWVRLAGHSTHAFQHGEGLLRELVHESFDALLFDWNVPDISGIEVLRRVRRESRGPVLFCTGRGDESDVVTALREGADDYLIKPVRRWELLARLQGVKRHSQTPAQDAIELGAIRVNCQDRTILRNNVPISIKDFDLSVLLLRNIGRLLSRREIRDAVWGSRLSLHSRTLDTHVSRVRIGLG